MPPRFHTPDLHGPAPTRVTLSPDESRHLARVLRLRPGATVEVFDGRGRMAAAIVADASTDRAVLDVQGDVAAQPEPPHPLAVCAALLKGDAMDAIVRDATVLGVHRLIPVITQRTIVRAGPADVDRLQGRWIRVAIAAAKQCGRARLPDVTAPRAWAELTSDASWHEWDRRVLVEPSAARAARAPAVGEGHPAPGALVLAVGPEGGWTPDELALAEHAGWTMWSLGPFTLRAEHVALASLSVVRYLWHREVSRGAG